MAKVLDDVTRMYFGRDLAQFRDICAWGCGCGRVVQALHGIANEARITGLDIDRDNVEWCRTNLTYGKFFQVPLYPPTDIPSGSFDLVYGISVFTHLARAAFDAWVDELYRIVRPRGVVLVTVHGGAALARVVNEELIRKTLDNGFNDESLDPILNQHISDPSYYRGTFLTLAEARRLFGRQFIVRDILPQASATTQDLVACERPD